jgi:very-short-patch-repair endonuclease
MTQVRADFVHVSEVSLADSPAEDLLALAFRHFLPAATSLDETWLQVVPQAPVGQYLSDFAVKVIAEAEPIVVHVEVDGHDFHERTKEQVRHNNRRDRYFAIRGLTVLRFSGSEIWNDAPACVAEVGEAIRYQRLRNARLRDLAEQVRKLLRKAAA